MVEPDKQKVYILFSYWNDDDQSDLDGVFSSKEKAEAARDVLLAAVPRCRWSGPKTYYIETEEVR